MVTMTARPVAQRPVGHGAYGMLFSEDGQSWGSPDRRMGLTIAGMWHLPYFRDGYAGDLVKAIAYIAGRDASLPPDPDAAVHLELGVDQVIAAISVGAEPDALALSLRQEPPLWGGESISQGAA